MGHVRPRSTLSAYRSFLAELETLARQERRCEEHQEVTFGNSRRMAANIEIDSENEAIAELSSTEELDESDEGHSNCPQGAQIRQRLAARWRQQTYRESWSPEQDDFSAEHLNNTKLETLRFCAARGYCECERNGFYRQVTLEMVIGTPAVDADGARSDFRAPAGYSEPQQQEYIRLRRQLEISRNNFIRRNSRSIDDDDEEESLLRLCSSNSPDVIRERFAAEE